MDAVERYRSVDELRESEERLSLFVENAPVALAMFDRELRFIAVSRRYIEIFSAPNDLIGRCAYDVFPEIPERWKQLHRRALAGETVSADEDLFLRSDLRAQWVKWNIRPWFDHHDNVGGILLATEDITARVEAQKKLRESEERLALVLESAGLGTWDWYVENGTLILSPRGLELLGIPAGTQMSYSRFLEAVHPEDRERIDQAVRRTLEGREPYDVEMRLVWPDGTIHWMAARGRAYFNEAGKATRMSGAGFDITARKKAEEALEHARSEAKARADDLQAILDAVPAGTFIAHDRDCTEMTSSRAGHEMLRLPPGANASKSALEGAAPSFTILRDGREVPPNELPVQQAAITGKPIRDQELKVRFEDGESIDLFGHAVPLLDEGGKVRGAVGAFVDITARKRAEERLEANERRMRLAQQAARAGTWDWDLRTGRIIQSAELEALYGLGPGAGNNADWWRSVVDPEDLPEISNRISEAISNRSDYHAQFRIRRPDGAKRWIEAFGKIFCDGDGTPLRIIGVDLDITDRRLAEAERDALAQQRQLALDSAQMGWWHYDPTTKFSKWDETFRKIYGIEGHSGASEEIIKLVHPDDAARAAANFREAMNPVNPKPYTNEYRIIRPDGSVRWVEAHGSAEFAGEGETRRAVRCSGTVREITERKVAEENLREQRERSEFVAESSDVGFWFCDLPFDKLIWDKRVKAHFWLPADADVTIDTFYERLHPEDREPTRTAMAVAIANKTQYDVEYRTMSVDGQQKWIRAIGRTFYDKAGEPRRFDGITLDITERKAAEEGLRGSEARYRELAGSLDLQVQERTQELRLSNEEVLRASQGLRELSRRVLRVRDEERRRLARELHDSAGQLLTALGLELSALGKEVKDGDDRLCQQLKSCNELVQQLQQEIRTTSYLLHPPLLDEAGLVSALQWYVQGLNQRSPIQTALEIPPDFGRLPRDIELVAFRLAQESLTNIHRHSGSKTARILVVREGDTVRIEIQDQGRGMSAEKMREIQVGGSGVGIQGMRERLRQYGGKLTIDSDDGGTRVVATIPIGSSLEDGGVGTARAAR